MQPHIPRKANQLQSRRFLTHQPTFESAPMQALAGHEFKQEDKMNIVQSPLVSGFVIDMYVGLTHGTMLGPPTTDNF